MERKDGSDKLEGKDKEKEMSLGFRMTGLALIFVTLCLPGVYYKAEVKALNFEREQQIVYWQGTMEQVYNRCIHDDKCDALGILFWTGQIIHEIEVLKVPIVSHIDPTFALGDFYFGWILN